MVDLYLVNIESLPEETALRLIQTLTTGPNLQVWSSTLASACSLLLKTQLKCDLVVDSHLNPTRSRSDASQYATFEDLAALKRRENTYVMEREVWEEETSDTSFLRIHNVLFQESTCRKVALLAQESLWKYSQWCSLTSVPMLLVFTVGPKISTKQVLYTVQDVRNYLAPLDLTRYTPQYLQLLSKIPGVISTIQFGAKEDDGSCEDMGNLQGILSEIEAKVRKIVSELQSKASELTSLRKDFKAVWAPSKEGLKRLQQTQTGVLTAIQATKTAALPVLQALTLKVEALEAKTENVRQAATGNKLFFTLTSAGRDPDSRLSLTFEKRKEYFLTGLLKIASSDTVVYQMQINMGRNQETQSIGEPDSFPGGEFSAWIESWEGNLMSNELVFTLKPVRNFTDSLVYLGVGNLMEIEENLRTNFGEERVKMMRRLAIKWSNESEEKVQELIYACMDEKLGSEEEVKADLQAKGLVFS